MPLLNQGRLTATVPISTLAQIDQIAEMTGMSKNKISAMAIDKLWKEILLEKQSARFEQEVKECLRKLA